MPSRKSTARQTSATPVKKTARSSALPDNASATRRSLRSTSQAPEQVNGVRGNLPEVQTQQSYAYGSSKAPLLPDQLRARERMNLDQLANTIDQQRSQADQRFRTHAEDTETNLTGKAETQKTRSTKPTTVVSPTRQDSPDSPNSDLRKTQRTAEWASSLESEHLQGITEEASELVDDDNTRHGTDPSSFPSGIEEHSYNYERGLRRPRILESGGNVVGTFFRDLGDVALQMTEDVAHVSRKTTATAYEALCISTRAINQILPYIGISIAILMTVALLSITLDKVFCTVYKHSFCDPLSTSALQARLQVHCGECAIPYTMLPDNLTPEQQADVSGIQKSIVILRRQLEAIEKSIDSKVDAKYSLFSTSVDELKERQHDIETHLSRLERRSTAPSKSIMEDRVNYFAPGAGAVIDPHRTSPKIYAAPNYRLRPWEFITRRKHSIGNEAAVALEAWTDVGGCWCAAGGEDIRLHVLMAWTIYPTDITIEHIVGSASPAPGTAPREVEVWANFAHLTPEEREEKGIGNLPSAPPLRPGMARIGSFVYEARPGADPVQTFRLDVNQGAMIHWAGQITVRVVSNYGAEATCLYRVKLYGEPVETLARSQAVWA